jgi:hypothetical protein
MWARRARPANPANTLAAAEPASGTAAAPQAKAARKAGRLREDLFLGLFGIALGLGSAMFPWYVFFNQEKFGVRAVTFDGVGETTSTGVSNTPQIVRIPDDSDLPLSDLDQLSTGTTPKDETASLLDQPFPTQDIPFQLVHVANGRAMIQDDTGLWVVQRGSVLPDMSRVASIEERGGAWVIVTSTDRVVSITR